MALAAKKIEADMAVPAPLARQETPWTAFSGAPSGSSVVGDMQRDLEERLRAPSIEGKWSARRTLAFIVATCGLFWSAVAALVLLA